MRTSIDWTMDDELRFRRSPWCQIFDTALEGVYSRWLSQRAERDSESSNEILEPTVPVRSDNAAVDLSPSPDSGARGGDDETSQTQRLVGGLANFEQADPSILMGAYGSSQHPVLAEGSYTGIWYTLGTDPDHEGSLNLLGDITESGYVTSAPLFDKES